MTIRKYSLLLFGAAFIAGAIGCTKETDTESAAEAETAAVSEPVSGWTVDDLAAALSDPRRAEADRARDAGRKPAEVVVFLGIEHGMTALDLIAAGGYYTEVLSVAVGPSGRVIAQNPPTVLQMRDGVNEKAMSARLADDHLANVTRLDTNIGEMNLEPGSVDAAITALNFHDVYNRRGAEAATGALQAVYAALKPGGVMGVIDHAGNPDAANDELHRVEEQLAVQAATDAGFVVEATSDALRNPDDDRSLLVFDEKVRGYTDRFLLRLRKPE